MYHYTLIQTSVYLQQKKAAQNGRCLSSVHHPFIDQRCPFRKADAKVDTFFTSTKYFGRKISKIFAQKSQRFVL